MPHQYLWRKFKTFMKYRVLHVNDTPHQIALGAAIGVFVAWTPTIGIQMALGVFLAALFKANKAITFPAAWISNPLTVVPIFWCNFKFGALLLGTPSHEAFSLLPQWTESAGLAATLSFIFDPRYWLGLTTTLLSMGLDLWVGSLILGLAAALIAYALTFYGVRQYRLRYRPDLLPRVREAGRKLALAARQKALRRKRTKRGVKPCNG